MKRITMVNYFCVIKKMNGILMRMKLLPVLIFVGIFAMNTGVSAQSSKIDLRIENSSLKEILNSIEKKSNFIFIYNSNIFNLNLKKSISVKDENIDKVLNLLFQGLNVSYKIDGQQVFIYKKDDVKKNEAVDKKKDSDQTRKRRISGVVTDNKGETIPGAAVRVKDTQFGTLTNSS